MANLVTGISSCLLLCQHFPSCRLSPQSHCAGGVAEPKCYMVFPARRDLLAKNAVRHRSYERNCRHGRELRGDVNQNAQDIQIPGIGGVRNLVYVGDDLLGRTINRTKCTSGGLGTVERVRLTKLSSVEVVNDVATGFKRGTETGSKKIARTVMNRAYITAPGAPSDGLYNSSPESDEELGNFADDELELRDQEDIINSRLVKSLIFKEKKRLLLVFASLVGGTSCTLSMPIFSGRFFETLIGKRAQPLESLLARLCLVYVMEPLFTVLFVTNMVKIWENVMKELRFRVFDRVLVQKVEFFDQHKVGELTSLLTTDLGSIKDIVNENVARDRGFRSLSEVLGTVTILFVLSPQLAPIMSILMLSISGLVAVYKRTTMPVFKAHGMAMARIGDTASETFSAIRTVRSFGGERRQTSMFEKQQFKSSTELHWPLSPPKYLGHRISSILGLSHSIDSLKRALFPKVVAVFWVSVWISLQVLAYQQSGIKLGWLKAVNESWTRMVIYVALMALYILGGLKVKSGQLAVGRMVSFIGYTFTLTFAMQGLVNTLADVRGAFAAADRINTVIRTGKVDESLARGLRSSDGTVGKYDLHQIADANKVEKATVHATHEQTADLSTLESLAWSGDVSLEDVHFSYPSRPDAEILKGVSLLMQNGRVTALVGSSGAGKSTIVQLLARFYEPVDGRISIAGQDVRKFDKSEWSRIVAIVNQEPVLFAMSIADNIAYGAPHREVVRAEVVEAAKSANAHDFIMSLPQGYETLVGERGGLLSGGQRQRVAIARALLRNSPILILDEATSSLDSVSERLVQNALTILMKGRTTLVIAHRLSTVQNAHQIVVCGDGKVLERGSHRDLLAKGGAYANLVNTQRVTIE